MRHNVWIIMEEQRPQAVILNQGPNSNRDIGIALPISVAPLCKSYFPLFDNCTDIVNK